jgi:hypothetical protein
MSKLIKVLSVRENSVDMQVAAAFITFALNGENVVDIARMPPPRECHVPENLMWDAKKQAKAILLGRKEMVKKTSA